MLPFDGGTRLSLAEVVGRVEEAARQHGIEGITLLGGEPLAHAPAGAAWRGKCNGGLSVMIFSGYTLEERGGCPTPRWRSCWG